MKKLAIIAAMLVSFNLGAYQRQHLRDTVVVESAVDTLDTVEDADTIDVPPKIDSTALLKHRVKARDLSRMAMQKRYQPKDSISSHGNFFGGTFLWAYGSFYYPFVEHYTFGPYMHAGVGKWFSTKDGRRRYHGVRAGLGAGYFTDTYDANRVKSADLRASYMFDLSAYASGYNPRLILSVVPVAGIGVTFMENQANGWPPSIGFSGHIGVDIAFHALPGVDIVVEGLYEIQDDPRKLVRQNLWRSYFPAFRGNVGLNINLDKTYWSRLGDPGQDWRVSVAGGLMLQFASDIKSMGDIPALIGPSVQIGVARRYNDWFHLRVQSGYSRYNWNFNEYGFPTRRLATDWNLHLDAMFDVLSMGKPNPDKRKVWGLFFMGGPTLGILHKEQVANLNIFPYVGLGGGIQLRAEVVKNIALFLEQRVDVVPYSTHSNRTDVVYAPYTDVRTASYFGVEYRFPYYGYSPSQLREEWSNGWYAMLYGSGYYPLGAKYTGGPFFMLGVTKWSRNIWALRLGGGAGYYISNRDGGRRVKSIGFRGSYLYNILPRDIDAKLSAVAGIGAERGWSTDGGYAWMPTAHLGLSLSMPVLKGVNLVIEPLIDVHPDLYSRVYGHSFDFVPAVMDNVGVEIALGQDQWKKADPAMDWRVSLAGGVRTLFKGPVGPEISLAVSRKIMPWLDFRLRGGYFSCNKGQVKAATLALDAMIDFLSLGQEAQNERRFSLAGFIGPEIGFYTRKDAWVNKMPFVGADAGIQGKVRIAGGLYAFLEPRVTFVPYYNWSAASNKQRFDFPVGAVLGIEYKFHSRK